MSTEARATILDEADVKKRIHDFILAKLLAGEEPVNLTDPTPLVSGGMIDSIKSLKIGLFLEKAFGVQIAPQELANPDNLETIAAIAALVAAKRP